MNTLRGTPRYKQTERSSMSKIHVVLDTETGGFSTPRNPLLSVSLVELTADLDPGRILTVYMHPLPGQVVDEGAAKVNGYTPEKWAARGAVSLTEGIQRICAWVTPGSKAVAHNAKFDKRFLDASFTACKLASPFLPEWSCTWEGMKMIQKSMGIPMENHKLDTLAQLTGMYKVGHVRETHEASEDALMCAHGYKWLIQRYRDSIVARRTP